MTKILYSVDIFAISLFVVSYYRNCYRQGYCIDVWHLMLFQICVLANQIMAPFAASDLNVLTLRDLWEGAREHIADAFVVSMVGYGAVLIGGSIWRKRDFTRAKGERRGLFEIVPRQSRLLMSHPGILGTQAIVCLLLQFWILSLYFSRDGFGLDLRLYTFEQPSLRPIAVIISNYSMIIGAHCFARYLERREGWMLLYTLLLSGGLIFFGSRTDVLMVYFMAAVCYFMMLRRRLGFLKLFAMGIAIIVVFTFGEGLREGYYSDRSATEILTILSFKIFYGNTFSDLRDFALAMSGWNGHLWLGRTYLAALMGFIPRAISSFRDTWSLGVMTTKMVGLDPDVHPGLRPGFFGESYFNFGYVGVVMMGLFIGAIVRRVDTRVKQELEVSSPSIMRAFSYTILLTIMTDIALSAGMATLFVMAAVFTISSLCRRMLKSEPSLA